jgi:hypothetical protein
MFNNVFDWDEEEQDQDDASYLKDTCDVIHEAAKSAFDAFGESGLDEVSVELNGVKMTFKKKPTS